MGKKIKGNRSFVGVCQKKEPATEGEPLSGAWPETEPTVRLGRGRAKSTRTRPNVSLFTLQYI